MSAQQETCRTRDCRERGRCQVLDDLKFPDSVIQGLMQGSAPLFPPRPAAKWPVSSFEATRNHARYEAERRKCPQQGEVSDAGSALVTRAEIIQNRLRRTASSAPRAAS